MSTIIFCSSSFAWKGNRGFSKVTELFGKYQSPPHNFRIKSEKTGEVKSFSFDDQSPFSCGWDGEMWCYVSNDRINQVKVVIVNV